MTDADVRKRCEEIIRGIPTNSLGEYGYPDVLRLAMATYADGQRNGMERAAKIAENRAGELTSAQCDGCGNYDDVAYAAANDEARDIAEEIRQAAKEI